MSDSTSPATQNNYLKSDTIRLRDLFEFAKLLNQQNDFKEILRVATRKSAELLNSEISVILMLNPKTRQTVKTIHREVSEKQESSYRSVQHQVSGWVMRNDKSLISSDLQKDERFKHVDFGKADVHSVIAVPLKIERLIIGTVILMNFTREEVYDESTLEFLEMLVVVAAPYLRNVQELKQYFEAPLPDAALFRKYEQVGLFGRSPLFKELLNAIEAAASCDIRVLLEGPSGTGKELVARAIHRYSSRSDKPFLAIDCGAIPENLLESELFGHVKGSFAGANSNRTGLMEEAHEGTLFMDEITNLPLPMQAKLMRVLQEAEVRPLGSNESRKVDVRIIAATNASLKRLVASGYFRQDLFFRLHVYPITLPSLAQRKDDIDLLTERFLNKASKEQGKNIQGLHEIILQSLCDRSWVGNVRELENFIERLVALTPHDAEFIDVNILPLEVRNELVQRRRNS